MSKNNITLRNFGSWGGPETGRRTESGVPALDRDFRLQSAGRILQEEPKYPAIKRVPGRRRGVSSKYEGGNALDCIRLPPLSWGAAPIAGRQLSGNLGFHCDRTGKPRIEAGSLPG